MLSQYNQVIVRVLAVVLLGAALFGVTAAEPAQLRHAADQMRTDGNWADAYQAYRKLLLETADGTSIQANDLTSAVECCIRLNAYAEFDELVQLVLERYPESVAVHVAAVEAIQRVPHWGVLVGDTFKRGEYHGGQRNEALVYLPWRAFAGLCRSATARAGDDTVVLPGCDSPDDWIQACQSRDFQEDGR